MKIKQYLIKTTLLSFPFLSLINVPIFLNNISNNKNIQLNNNINIPKKFSLEEYYKINEFDFGKIGGNNEQGSLNGSEFLISYSKNSNRNLIFPFANKVSKTGEILNEKMENTIEIDLNIWKPIGMDDEKFLKETTFGIDGKLNTGASVYEVRHKQPNIIKYNETKSTLVTDKISKPGVLIEATDKVGTEKKIYNMFSFDKNVEYNNDTYSWCYIIFDVVHEQSEDLTKENAINRILITPKIKYLKNFNEKVDKLKQKNQISLSSDNLIKFTFYNNFFAFNQDRRILVDSYISDNKNFNLYESSEDKNNNLLLNNFLTLDTDNSATVILSSTSEPGKQIPQLEIDTSNFYLTNDKNNSSKKFIVTITGVKLYNIHYRKSPQANDNGKDLSIPIFPEIFNETLNVEPDELLDLDISFEISKDDFINKTEKIVTINIINRNLFGKLIGNEIQDASLKLEITIKQALNNDKSIIPFKYVVDKFKFIGQDYQKTEGEPYNINIGCQIYQSSEVIVKVKPKDFSFTKMQQAIIKMQKQIHQFSSPYSSNVFDNSTVYDSANNKMLTNYQRCLNEIEKRFINLISVHKDFRNAGVDSTNPLALFEQPFIQTQYTSDNNQFRTQGKMTLKYAPKFNNKYFASLDVILRNKVNKTDNQKEIIMLAFNHENLNQAVKLHRNLDSLINYLNNLSLTAKTQFFNFTNLDNDENIITAISNIQFAKSNYNNVLSATINCNSNFHFYNHVDQQFNKTLTVNSNQLHFSNFIQTVSISLNENEIRKASALANDYDDFKQLNLDKITNYINLSYNGSTTSIDSIIKTINFTPLKNHTNKIGITIQLNDGFLLPDFTNTITLFVGNINWKNQNNSAQPIKITFDYQLVAAYFANYWSLADYLEQNPNYSLNDFANAITFHNIDSLQAATINDLESISITPNKNSPNKVNIRIQAKDWKYFVYPGSTTKNDSIEFIISNINWKDQPQLIVQPIKINIDMQLLYHYLVVEYAKNKDLTLNDFVFKNIDSFLKYNDQQNSFIKIDPYDVLAINAPYVASFNNGIYIKLELNNGYFVKPDNYFDQNENNSVFETFISINDILLFHLDYVTPNSQSELSVDFNYNKLQKDAFQFLNIDAFINIINNDYSLFQYLIVDHVDQLKKIKTINVIKNSPNSLIIKLQLFDSYYFTNEAIGNKTKQFVINNLVFKNQTQSLKAISVKINEKSFYDHIKQFDSIDHLLAFYANKNSYDDYQHFINIAQKELNGIENIIMAKANSIRAVQVIIKAKPLYYFNNFSIHNGEYKIIFNNLLFKNDPSYENSLVGVNVLFKGNEFNQKANQFSNFEQYKSYLLENNHWQQFIQLEFNKPSHNNTNVIDRFSIISKSKNQAIIKIKLKDGYYFTNNSFLSNEKEIIVGNIIYQNQTIQALENVDIRFNQTKFYKLFKDETIDNWDQFLEIIKPEIINFNDKYNGVLWSNVNSYDAFNTFLVSIEDNYLTINFGLNNGYYFTGNDNSNVELELKYSINDLNRFFNNGKQIISNNKFQIDLIIWLLICIPYAILFAAIIFYIVRSKKKNRI